MSDLVDRHRETAVRGGRVLHANIDQREQRRQLVGRFTTPGLEKLYYATGDVDGVEWCHSRHVTSAVGESWRRSNPTRSVHVLKRYGQTTDTAAAVSVLSNER